MGTAGLVPYSGVKRSWDPGDGVAPPRRKKIRWQTHVLIVYLWKSDRLIRKEGGQIPYRIRALYVMFYFWVFKVISSFSKRERKKGCQFRKFESTPACLPACPSIKYPKIHPFLFVEARGREGLRSNFQNIDCTCISCPCPSPSPAYPLNQ